MRARTSAPCLRRRIAQAEMPMAVVLIKDRGCRGNFSIKTLWGQLLRQLFMESFEQEASSQRRLHKTPEGAKNSTLCDGCRTNLLAPPRMMTTTAQQSTDDHAIHVVTIEETETATTTMRMKTMNLQRAPLSMPTNPFDNLRKMLRQSKCFSTTCDKSAQSQLECGNMCCVNIDYDQSRLHVKYSISTTTISTSINKSTFSLAEES